jgi:hypothetical protein
MLCDRIRGQLLLAIATFLAVTGCGGGGDKATNPPSDDGAGGGGWSTVGDAAVNGTVYALYPAGSALLVGGEFTSVGVTAAQNVARWDGTAWSAMGQGLPMRVTAFAVFQDTVMAGMPSGIAAWNGSNWLTVIDGLGSSPYGPLAINALAVYTNDAGDEGLYAGSSRGPILVYKRSFVLMGVGHQSMGESTCLTVFDGDLISGGYWNQSGSGAIVRWNGGTPSWPPVGSGTADEFYLVHALLPWGTNLVAGGEAQTLPTPHRRIQIFNGAGWQPMATGVNGTVYALAVYHGDLIAGGEFTMAGSDSASYVARWDGTNWRPLGSGLNFTVYALAVYDDALIVGGAFTTAGGKPAHGIAAWRD